MHWVDFCSFSSAVWHTTFLNNGSSSPQHAGFDEDVLHLGVVGDGAVVSRLHLAMDPLQEGLLAVNPPQEDSPAEVH